MDSNLTRGYKLKKPLGRTSPGKKIKKELSETRRRVTRTRGGSIVLSEKKWAS